MGAAPLPGDEASRLAALRALKILDSPREETFDDLTRVAAEFCGAPVALISFVDRDRQWFKSRVNFTLAETTRDTSFCAHSLEARDLLVVPDTHADPRFADNPLVTGGPHFRFYAGVPLRVDDGSAVGTLCVLDYAPRELSAAQLTALRSLGRQIATELQRRRTVDSTQAAVDERPVPLGPGDVVGKRKIVRAIGKGGIGTVFEAIGERGERVALKVLHREWASREEVLARFAREARILRLLTSPHVCKLVDVGNLEPSRGGLPFLVLEYLEGFDLEQVIATRKKVPWRLAAGWIADACAGIAEAHDHGVIHRDVKPSNVFLSNSPREAPPVVKVLDFGIARADAVDTITSKLTGADESIGTPLYMAPEQMLDPRGVGPRSDVWSMGAVLFELVTGKVPFSGRNEMEVCAHVLTRPPPAMSDTVAELPDAFVLAVSRCLEKRPEARHGEIRDVANALKALIGRA